MAVMSCVDVAAGECLQNSATHVAGSINALPLVSVVIPVKNDAERLGACLASLGRQSYPADRYEVIVVDNGSSDRSVEVADEHGAKVLVQPGLRVGALRNRGVEVASGDVLAFIDSDHEAPEHWLHYGAMELRASGTRMIGSPCQAPANGTWVQRGWEKHRLRRRDRHLARWLGAGNMFVRKADFVAVGGFREDLVAAEDVDLCLRLKELSGDIVSDLRVTNTHHGEPATLLSFFRKEFWRGSSGLRAFFAQGLPLAELPTLLYPIYHLVAVLGLLAGVVWAFWLGSPTVVLAAIGILMLPSTVMAMKTSWQIGEWRATMPLVVLYLAYGLARAAALFR